MPELMTISLDRALKDRLDAAAPPSGKSRLVREAIDRELTRRERRQRRAGAHAGDVPVQPEAA